MFKNRIEYVDYKGRAIYSDEKYLCIDGDYVRYDDLLEYLDRFYEKEDKVFDEDEDGEFIFHEDGQYLETFYLIGDEWIIADEVEDYVSSEFELRIA